MGGRNSIALAESNRSIVLRLSGYGNPVRRDRSFMSSNHPLKNDDSVCHQLGQLMLDVKKYSVIVAYNTEHLTQDIDMTRKLHNTLMATLASSSLLILGIVASSPIAPEFRTVSTNSVLASLEAHAEIAANAINQPEATPIQQARAVRHRRQSLAMPFYSFAPRS